MTVCTRYFVQAAIFCHPISAPNSVNFLQQLNDKISVFNYVQKLHFDRNWSFKLFDELDQLKQIYNTFPLGNG